MFRELVDGLGCEKFLIGGTRVPRDFLERPVSGNSSNLLFGTTGFSELPRGGLAEAV